MSGLVAVERVHVPSSLALEAYDHLRAVGEHKGNRALDGTDSRADRVG